VLLGMIELGEQLTWRTLAGGALILSGIALVVLRRQTKAPEVAAETFTPEVR
jgi:drug/metabolite transporter (DMT)-like permease